MNTPYKVRCASCFVLHLVQHYEISLDTSAVSITHAFVCCRCLYDEQLAGDLLEDMSGDLLSRVGSLWVINADESE